MELNHRRLYRLPWSLTDNVIAWLEPTSECNMYCEGCYRANETNGHKTLQEIRQDLETFKRYRNFDSVSIAGGDPLTHPQIVQIVEMIAADGFKPILNTNGMVLTKGLLLELKRAGLAGLTLHIDSKQSRPGWKGKNEIELNQLRLAYARMVAEVGGLTCAFNSTVYEDTLKYVPDIVAWAQDHIDIVHVVVFIAYRAAILEGNFDYYAGAEKIDASQLAYAYQIPKQRVDISAPEIAAQIRTRFQDYQPCAYLNGTEKPDSFKWLLTARIGTKQRILGYVGPKFIELVQTMYHLIKGRYLAYANPRLLSGGRALLLLWPFDHGIRSILKGYLRGLLRNPFRIFQPLHLQAIMIIQPADILADGRQNMCDGCPDITAWNDQLVWSCRLDECLKFGCFVRTVPKVRNHARVTG